MKSKALKTLLPIIIIAVAIVITVILIASKPKPEKEEVLRPAFLVEAKALYTEDVEFLVYSQGSVQAKRKTVLSPQVSGKIVSISDKFNAGEFVQKGDLLLNIESDDYQTELLLAEAELARAKAALDEERARGRVAEKEWSSINSSAPPELGLRKPQLAREQANVKAAQANLERAKRNLSRTEVRAPFDGVVKERLVDLGQFIATASQLGEIFSTDIAEVRLPLTDNDVAFLGDINEEQTNVTLSADVAGTRHYWQGVLVRDEAILDENRRVIYGVVEIEDPYNLKSERHASDLKFGRFVSASITGLKANNIIKLPREIIRLDGTVLTVDNNNEISINTVDIMRLDEEFAYIRGGLSLEHKVVTSAISTPYNGMPVRFTDDKPSQPPATENEQNNEVSL